MKRHRISGTQQWVLTVALMATIAGMSSAHAGDWEAVLGRPWSSRLFHQMTYFNGDYYLSGGSRGGARGGVWRSADGDQWDTLVPDEAAPPYSRSGHAQVAFQGKLWILGGYDGGQELNDILSSADGRTWDVETPAPWDPRDSHRALVFDNKIWVLGGVGDTGFYNDVWYSADGVSWTEATSNALWSPRAAFGALTDATKMYILGGWFDDGLGTDFEYNDVWSSTDGVTWTQETAAASWSPRSDVGAAFVNGTMFLAGGYESGTRHQEVWSSADGATWVPLTAAAAWPARYGLAMATDGTELLITGGRGIGSAYYNDAWASTDGISWTERSQPNVPWGPFTNFPASAAEVMNGAMWHFYDKEVWTSTDGISWTKTTAAGPWSAVGNYATAVHDGTLWVTGGRNSNYIDANNEVWWSSDGANWNFAGNAPWTPRMNHTATSFNGELWIIAGDTGTTYDELNDVWHSADGATWTEAAAPPWTARQYHSAVVFNGKLWMLGGLNNPPGGVGSIYYTDAWTTADGQTWTHVSDTLPGSVEQGVVANGRLWFRIPQALVTTADGHTWHYAAAFTNHVGDAFAWFDDRFWLMGGFNMSDPQQLNLAVHARDYSTLVLTNVYPASVFNPNGIDPWFDRVMAPGGSRPIIRPHLLTLDETATPSQILYTLTTAPSTGTVRMDSTPLALNDTFSQEDVNLGRIDYVDDGIASGPVEYDFFDLEVTDGTYAPAWLRMPIEKIDEVVAINAYGGGTLNFTDATLEAAVRAAIGKPTGDLLNMDFLGLTILSASNGVVNINGLEWATNLETLELWWANAISDVRPLAGLTKLQYLDLESNTLSDITPLASLTNLRTLWLNNNTNISDTSALGGLTNLLTLYLGNNSISDISGLAGLTNLRHLFLNTNSVSDISVLAGLTKLGTLWINNNSISDISALVANSGLGSGDYVYLRNNPLNAQALCLDIPTLTGRGVYVSRSQACDDQDFDGLTDAQESTLGTHSNNADSDGDGISDGDEVNGTNGHVTNPNNADSDGDGVSDGVEATTGTDPNTPDQPEDTTLGSSTVSSDGPAQADFDGQVVDTITVGGAKDGSSWT